MSYLINVEIAGINFSINCRDLIIAQDSDPVYRSFFKTDRKPVPIDINIDLELNNIPDTGRLKKIFDSGQSWSMFADDNDYFLTLNPPVFKQPLWLARINRNFTRVTVYCSEKIASDRNGKLTVSNPIGYPFDQILLMYFLAQKEGALIHAAGVDINGRGYIFPGKSGAGKSTLSRLFTDRNDVEPLSDDRIVVRKIVDTFKAFGTPWAGEAGIAVNKHLPLCGIFFIHHYTGNKIKEIKPVEAFERLMPVTSIPWYDKEIMTRILTFCEDLISNIPAYDFYFKPGTEVVDVFKKFVSK